MTVMRTTNSGFTLTELMIVVAIAGILAAIAIPSFTSLGESQRVKSASFEMYALLNIARSEAIKRNGDVTVAVVKAGSAFDRIDITAPDGVTLLKSSSAPRKVGIEALGANGLTISGVTYQRTGRTTNAGLGATFEIDVEGATTPTQHVRCITIGLSGSPQTRKGAC